MLTFALGALGWMVTHPYAGIPLAILGWALFVTASPYRQCRWCKNRRPGRRCWRCKGARQSRRLGAGLVHRVRLSLVRAWQERGQQ